ncbi:hypothetical protein D3C72_1200750 [compost metagenome]
MPVELFLPARRLAPGRTGRARRRTGLRRAGADRRMLAGRRGARPHGSQDPEAAADHRRHVPVARRARRRPAGPDPAGANPRRLRQPVRTHHAGPHPRPQGRIPLGPRRPDPSAPGLRTPAPSTGMPGHPDPRLRHRRRPPGRTGPLVGARVSQPRLGRAEPAVPVARRSAPRRRRPCRAPGRSAHRGGGPGADACAIAQAPARHVGRHPHAPACRPMRLRII